MFVYESVPGTAVFSLKQDGSSMEFEVEGAEDAQITVEMEADTEYSVPSTEKMPERCRQILAANFLLV